MRFNSDKITSNKIVHIAVLFLTVFVLYYHISSFDYTGSDDKTLISYISSQIALEKTITEISNAPYMFKDGLFYRPLITVSFFLVFTFAKILYWQFLLNILIHFLSVLMFYYILIELKASVIFSFSLSMIFSVLPVTVNSVAWLPGRNDSLAALFVLSAFLFLLIDLRNKNIIYFILCSVFLLLALFTKETALLAIPVFILYIFLIYPKYKFSFLKISVWLIAAVMWYIARNSVIPGIPEPEYTANLAYIFIGAGNIIFPINLSVLPVIADMQLLPALGSTLLLVILYFYLNPEFRKKYLFGLIFYIIFILPAIINKNPEFNSNIMLESRLYLPAAGVLIMIAAAEEHIIKFIKLKILIPVVLLLSIIYFAISYNYSESYRNDVSFWNNARRNSPSLDLSFSGMGLILLQKGRYEESLNEYEKAIKLNSDKGEYYSKAAYCCLMLNRTEEAEKYYRKYISFFPGDPDANMLLGIINYKKRNYIEAESFLKKSAELNSGNMQPVIYLAKLYSDTGDKVKAKQQIEMLQKNNVKIPEELEYLLN